MENCSMSCDISLPLLIPVALTLGFDLFYTL